MQGTEINDVYLILRNGCKQANAVFLASFKILNSCKKLILMQGLLHIIDKTHAIVMVASMINNSFKRN
jgi:hypothetical protein